MGDQLAGEGGSGGAVADLILETSDAGDRHAEGVAPRPRSGRSWLVALAVIVPLLVAAELWRRSRVPEPRLPPDSVLAELLAAMPGSDGADGRPLTGRIRFIDIDRLTLAAGLDRPAVDASDEVVGGWTEEIGLADLGIFGPLWPQTSVARWHRDLGFYAHEVTHYAGTSDGTSYFKVLTDPDEVRRRLQAPSEWSDDLRVDTYLGFDYFDWDRARDEPCSRRDRNLRTLGRLSGCGGQLAVLDDLVIHASEIGSMRRALSAVAGVVPNRAEVGASARLLVPLDDLPLVTSEIRVFENIVPDDTASGESLGYAWNLAASVDDETVERVAVITETDDRHAARYGRRMEELTESEAVVLPDLTVEVDLSTVTLAGIPDDSSVVACCFGPLESPFDPDWFPQQS